MIQLRPYQSESIEAAYEYCRTKDGNPLIIQPTGAGKTLTMAMMARDIVRWHYRPIIISHSPELVQQTHDEIASICPELRPSMFCNKLKKKDLSGRVVVASVQSLYYAKGNLGQFRVAMVDEADSIPNERTTGMYHDVIRRLQANDEKLRLIGLTATPYRLDGGLIYGDGMLFSDICHEAEIADLVTQGFLCPITTRIARAEVSRSGLKVRQGEYTEASMNAAFATEQVVRTACMELIHAMRDRRKCLVFCCSLIHCELVSRFLPDAAILTYETPDRVRESIISGFKSGHIRYLININICAVGFNVRDVDTIAMMRPTMSARLYYQQAGRGMRIHPSKSECHILDFAGNARQHGPINRLTEWITRKEKRASTGGRQDDDGEERVRVCPECRTANPLEFDTCMECGETLIVRREIKQEAASDKEAVLIDMDRTVDGFDKVDAVEFHIHEKQGSPASVRIIYHLAYGKSVSEWRFPEGRWTDGFSKWWKANSREPVPRDAREAVEKLNQGHVTLATHIRHRKNAKGYPEIVARRYRGDSPQIINMSGYLSF